MAEKDVFIVFSAAGVDVPTVLEAGVDDSSICLVITNERISCALNFS